MPPGLDNLKHIVVLMMENRSFDHMLGYMQVPGLDGLKGNESNPDTNGQPQSVQPTAAAQKELDPDPDHSWTGVNTQIFGNPQGTDDGSPKMQGFIKSYFTKMQDVNHSRNIMNCFSPDNVPVLTTLAQQFAVCDRWFSSLPGPTVPNRLFAHFGTSFANVDNAMKFGDNGKSIYSRLMNAGRSTKIYYFDEQSASVGFTFLLQNQPQTMGTYNDFLSDCANSLLPDYSFVEPNYSDHSNLLASDQHPDHNVIAGENFIADVYNHIRQSPLWESILLLIVYDEHGGTFDHVLPPQIQPDGTPDPVSGFQFNRLGIRVPAVFVSPWVQAGTIIHTQYEHASIPATAASLFIANPAQRNLTIREQRANLFTADPNLLTLSAPRQDSFFFQPSQPSLMGIRGLTIAAQADESGPREIPIPTPPADAYDPSRPMGVLLHDHIVDLSRLEQKLPPDQRTNVDVSKLKTEADASAYSARVVPLLRAQGLKGGQR
ncbi:MAG TPA: alkaline phosphatase family protein [Terriglobales bacterium]|nr:alkaline phosphatase family protein [Terriglobales bacterium]